MNKWHDIDDRLVPFGLPVWVALETINGTGVRLALRDNAGWHNIESVPAADFPPEKVRAWAHLEARPVAPERKTVWS